MKEDNSYAFVPIAFSGVAKPIGSLCNLKCDYCYYLEKHGRLGGQAHRMADSVLEEYIEQYIQSQNVPEVTFVWHGGEPLLLGLPYFQKILRLEEKYARGKVIWNSVQTNGMLVTEEWAKFFATNKFLVGLSLDGPKDIHDAYRHTKGDGSAYAGAMRAVELFLRHKVDFNILATVNKSHHSRGRECYLFFKSIGAQFIQFSPVVERLDGGGNLQLPDPMEEVRLADYSVDGLKYGEFLIDVFDEWVRHDVGVVFIPTFDSMLANLLGKMPAICIYGETCGHAPAIEANGDVYPCDHYVFPELRLGNIMHDGLVGLMFKSEQVRFGKSKRDGLPPQCQGCKYLGLCFGECPKNRFLYDNTGTYGLNYLCKGLHKFYEHILPYMQFMANEFMNERPASNIMGYLRGDKL